MQSMIPGTGWAGATVAGNIGTSTAKAIARWDTVPFQTISSSLNVAVAAFHKNGIQKVAFGVNGGPWVEVATPVLNPETNVTEYFCSLNIGDFANDGKIEIRAIIYPIDGVPRILQDVGKNDMGDGSLTLYVNPKGSLNGTKVYVSKTGADTNPGTETSPFLTIEKAVRYVVATAYSGNNCTIYLSPGTYNYPSLGDWATGVLGADNSWLTVEGIAGTNRSVVITGPTSNPSQKKLKFKNVIFKGQDANPIITEVSTPFGNHVWIDQCDIEGLGVVGTNLPGTVVAVTSSCPVWYTNVNIRNVRSTGLGDNCYIIRNVKAQNISGDFLNCNKLLINNSVDKITITGTDHPDVLQCPVQGFDNMIVYGLRADHYTAQGITLGGGNSPISNIALINILLNHNPDVADAEVSSTPAGPPITNHILIDHLTIYNQSFMIGLIPGTHTNYCIRNSIFTNFGKWTDQCSWEGVEGTNNHFISPVAWNGDYSFGTNYTVGDPKFTDPVNGDFTPTADSPLYGRSIGYTTELVAVPPPLPPPVPPTIKSPIAYAGADQLLTITNNRSNSITVTLDGSKSASGDYPISYYGWYETGKNIANGVQPKILLGSGIHNMMLITVDNHNLFSTDNVTITVRKP